MSQPTFSYGAAIPGFGTPAAAPAPAAAAPAGGDDLVRDVTTQTFVKDVIEGSRQQPVLVDFWAEWCGPCKQLAPALEKAVKAAKGKVRLYKMDIDRHPEVAGQLGIRSIPAVIAFKNGQPVDGFMGAVPESQITQFIEKIAGPVGPSESEQVMGEAEEAFGRGEYDQAAELFSVAASLDPQNIKAIAGVARAEIALGRIDEARAIMAELPPEIAADAAFGPVKAQLELAEQSADLGDKAELEAKIARDPNDHQARIDLAVWLAGRGDREAAVDQLIESVRKNRQWNEEAARKQLLQFFEAWGPTDEWTLYGRRRLSSVLFA